MLSQDIQISLFQFLFVEHNIEGLLESINQWIKKMQMEKSNKLFSHVLDFNIETMKTFSEDLSETFQNDFPQFKCVLNQIIYNIIIGIIKRKANQKNFHLDKCMVRISLAPYNIPFIREGFHSSDGSIIIGNYFYIKGNIVSIEQPKRIIIRYLYKCKCGNSFYLNGRTGCRNNDVFCKKCNEKAYEFEKGRIIEEHQKIIINPETGFFYPYIDFYIKNHFDCIFIGKSVEIVSKTVSNSVKVIVEDNVKIKPYYNNKLVQHDCLGESFKILISKLNQWFPYRYYPLKRIAFAAMINSIICGNLLYIVQSIDDMKIILNFLQNSVFDKNEISISVKEVPLFSRKEYLPHSRITIITHFELNTGNKLSKIARIISQYKLTSPPIICIAVSNDIDIASVQKQYNECFSSILRINSIPKKFIGNVIYFKDLSFKKNNSLPYFITLQKKIHTINLTEEAENMINSYLEYCEDNIFPIYNFSKGISALIGNNCVHIDDVLISLLFSEERQSALSNVETELSQFPNSNIFFSPGISSFPTDDEYTLFMCWKNLLDKVIENK